MGMLNFPEPFLRLFNQGSISMGGKAMSKSLGNVVEAAAAVERFGADATRLFIIFCSPPGAAYDFPADGLEEIGRVAFSWLSRVWRGGGGGPPRAPPGEEGTTMVIQVNGRARDTVEVPVTIPREEMQAVALDREKVIALLDGNVPAKIITVPPRLVTLVVV